MIFSLIQSLHLATLYWSTWSTLAGMVNMEVVDLDIVLDDMERVGQVWLKKGQNQGCKVGKML
jgi:hypothetical protein